MDMMFDGRMSSMIEVCATGYSANTWQAGIDDVCSLQIINMLGYTETCDIYLEIENSCAPPYKFGTACQRENIDFPHSCFPGNSIVNGGYQSGTGMASTPFRVLDLVKYKNAFSFQVTNVGKGNCYDIVPKTGPPPPSCCDMEFEKIEWIINDNCVNAIESFEFNG